ncbi:hypothetical protein [Photobacterium sp. TY1-4]|uniref:hypothetical protein n=1 Tax=Photobacterium sp. TY1-4 TaxID=2899122 RepID=UPI0021BFBDB5|nr:hypothetical protein [Photobacterium sp. TY1-4]UXI04523.1 hypothetical protein NH461_20780 [Photobacterium sp. TY1-4]
MNSNQSSVFSELLKIHVEAVAANTRSIYHQTENAETKRAIAAACALELIKSEVTGCETSNLEYLLDNLKHFTDMIQKALEVAEDKK